MSFLLDWANCLLGSTNTYSTSWGSFDCKTSSTSGCSTTSYNSDSCIKLNSTTSSNTITTAFDCDVKDVSFNLYNVDLSKCGDGKLVDVNFKNALGQLVEAKYELVNGVVKVTCAEPVQTVEICYSPSSYNYCDLKVGSISCAPVPTGDGVVEGTGGDDVIDVAYIGDPEGDKIDNNDALLSGETGHDDIVVAGDGDDTVLSGAGNDEVYGGAGNDDIDGGAGNDILIGDRESATYGSPSATTTVRESFNWSKAPEPDQCDTTTIDNGDKVVSFTQDTGEAKVTFSTTKSVYTPETTYSTDTQKVHSIDTGSEVANANSSLSSELNAKGESVTYQLSFDKSVGDVSFRINDVDYDSTVKVYAYDANGVAVEVNVTAGGGIQLQNLDGVAGNETGVSLGGSGMDTDPNYSMLVNVAGPISKLVIVHLQDGYNNSGINITDVFFDVTIDAADGVAGNDVIDGGDGDDYIEGNAGDDTLTGGNGNDAVLGGEGNDIIKGDAGSTSSAGSEPAVLDWTDYAATGSSVANGAVQDIGGVDVKFSFNAQASGSTAKVISQDQYVEAGENFDSKTGLQLYGAGSGGSASNVTNTSTVTLDFTAGDADHTGEVKDVSFRINDMDVGPSYDTHNDIVTIRAYDADGNEVPVTFVTEGGQTVSGNTISSSDIDTGNISASSATGSVLVQIAGPVAKIVIDYDNGGATDQAVTLTDFDCETILVEDTAGNDYLDGGAGNDLIEGNEGDDRLIGGDGNDTLMGGDGNDVIDDVRGSDNDGAGNDYADGGKGNDEIWTGKGDDTLLGGEGNDLLGGEAGNDILDGGEGADWVMGGNDRDYIYGGKGDVIDGGAGGDDYDTLDLTGKGPYYLADVTTDSNGNGINGTVVFVDTNGVPTGDTIKFTEIEKVIGDEYNRAPDAVDDVATTDEDKPVTINVLGNDTDPDGDTLTVTGASATHGTVVVNSNGTLTFTPDPDFNGEATITYTVTDPDGKTDTASVTLTVNPVNDAPDAKDDTASTDFGKPVVINVLANDTDPDGDALTITTATSPDGTVSVDGDGNLVFTPATGFSGEATITYTIVDEGGLTDTATVKVLVAEDPRDGTVEGTAGDDIIDYNYTGDPEGDMVDHEDAILPGDVGNDDLIYGFEGNDTIVAGDGADEVYGGSGNDSIIGNGGNDTLSGDEGNDIIRGGFDDDTIYGGTGNDSIDGMSGDDLIYGGAGDDQINGGGGEDQIYGEAGNDVIEGGNNEDVIYGGTGDDTIDGNDSNDVIHGGEGKDVINGGAGEDTLYGDAGNDVISGGNGNDSVVGGIGSDTVYGGEGDDVIDTANPVNPLPDLAYPGLWAADANPNNDKDFVDAGAGNDIITTGDDADTIYGGTGDDQIDGGIDADLIDGGEGNDIIVGGEGSDSITGGAGDDTIYGGLGEGYPDAINIPDDAGDLVTNNGKDVIDAGAGNDIVFGKDDDDTIYGGTGDDYLDGGVDDDVIAGGDGQDTIIGGEGTDDLSGGFGSDTFLGGNGGDTVVGGEDADGKDWDVLDLTGSNVDFITYASGDPESGVVTFLDGSTMTFSEIENVIPCFTPGTMIATIRGEVPVEQLCVGDRVITRDNGIQEIAWVGHKEMTGKQLVASPHLKPVLIKAGALGNGLPERDMVVSPNHRLLVASDLTQLYFEESEVLAAAKHLVGSQGIHQIDVMQTTYIHFMFERHEVVLSNGAWTESFQPGDYSLKGIGNSQRDEILELFPELRLKQGLENYQAARKSLKKHEAKLLIR